MREVCGERAGFHYTLESALIAAIFGFGGPIRSGGLELGLFIVEREGSAAVTFAW